MCCRYRLSRRKQLIQEYFDTADEVDWEPRYNIAPSQSVGIIRQDRAKPERRFSLGPGQRQYLCAGVPKRVYSVGLLGAKTEIPDEFAVPIQERWIMQVREETTMLKAYRTQIFAGMVVMIALLTTSPAWAQYSYQTINGINDKGQIVGFYVGGNGNTDGFYASAAEGMIYTEVDDS